MNRLNRLNTDNNMDIGNLRSHESNQVDEDPMEANKSIYINEILKKYGQVFTQEKDQYQDKDNSDEIIEITNENQFTFDHDDINKDDEDEDPFSKVLEQHSPEKKSTDENEEEDQTFLQHNFWKTTSFNIDDIMDDLE